MREGKRGRKENQKAGTLRDLLIGLGGLLMLTRIIGKSDMHGGNKSKFKNLI